MQETLLCRTDKLKRSLFWNAFGSVSSKALLMLAAVLTARILGASHNGEFGMINNTIGMLATFATLGLSVTATRFVVSYKEKAKERCGNVIAMTFMVGFISSLIFSFVLFFGSEWLSENAFNNKELSISLRLSSIMLVVNTLHTLQDGVLAGFEDFKAIAKISMMQGIISLPIFIVFTLWLGVNGLVLGYGMVGLIVVLVAGKRIRKLCKENRVSITYGTCMSEYKLLFYFALPIMLMNIVVIPVTWMGNTMMIQESGGYYHLGVFNAANQWRSAISLLPAAIGNVILPFIISNDDNSMEDINILSSWFIVLILASGVVLVSGFITTFYGASYDYATLNTSISIICAVCVLFSLTEGISRNLVKYSHMWLGFFNNLFWGISFLISIFFLKKWGAIGMSLTYFIAYFITAIIFVPFYIKKGIVNKKYFFNSKILIVWIVFTVYLLVSIFTSFFWIKLLFFFVNMVAAYMGCESFFCISKRIRFILEKRRNQQKK